MTLTTIAHTKFIDRIYDILISDSEFKKTFGSNIIKGQPTNERTGNENTDMPWVNIIEADNPIVSKKITARGNPPSYLITLEYWIVIHAVEESSVDTHNKLTQYATEVETIMQTIPTTIYISKRFECQAHQHKTCYKTCCTVGKCCAGKKCNGVS